MPTTGKGRPPVRSPKPTRLSATKQTGTSAIHTAAIDWFFGSPISYSATASLSGAGTVVVSGVRTALQTASLSGAGTLSATGVRTITAGSTPVPVVPPPWMLTAPMYVCRVCRRRFRSGAELLAHRELHKPEPVTPVTVTVTDATPRLIAADDELLLAGIF